MDAKSTGSNDTEKEEEEEDEEGQQPPPTKPEDEEEEEDPRALLTKEQIDYFKAIFDSFDTQKKERIPAKTLAIVLRMMGLNPSKAEIKKILQEVDPSNKGLIDFQTFLLPIAQRIEQEPENHEQIIEAFRVLDEDGSDYITIEKLNEYMTTMAEDLEDFEIEILLKMAETKGTGKVHYVDFVEKMMGIVRKNPKKDKKAKGKKKK